MNDGDILPVWIVIVDVELFEREPDIAGVALPGMPDEKDREWIVYVFDGDGRYEQFAEL